MKNMICNGNDQAACGALKGFVHQLNGRVNSGQITEADGKNLLIAAEETQTVLGCK